MSARSRLDLVNLMLRLLAPVAASLLALCAAQAAPITAGEFVVEPSTLISAGFEWHVQGDPERRAHVDIRYRKQGDSRWHTGLPFMRKNGERTVTGLFNDAPYAMRAMSADGHAFTYVAPNMFAGSLFDLEPDTQYEVQARMSHPDGVRGNATRTAIVRTRVEPKPFAEGRAFHVYPPGYSGARIEPSFDGLYAAYYTGGIGGDWFNAFPPRVRPGDRIIVHAGLYKDSRLSYGHEFLAEFKECCATTWDGTYYLTQSGTADRPIAIIAAGDGEVIFDGDGNGILFDVTAADYTYFEGITFRNTNLAILGGRKRIVGSKGLTVKHCKFESVGIGVISDYSGSTNYYIADNIFSGLHDPEEMVGWEPIGYWSDYPGIKRKNLARSQYAVKIYGAGSVVAYNRIRNFHDGVDHATYGDPDGWPDPIRERVPVSIDFYNNDISNMHDNCIETDGAMYNIRVMRNRCVNIGEQGFSEEPLLGGPAYFIRNIVYNSPGSGVKFSGDPSGGVFLHNSFLSGVRTSDGGDRGANAMFLNNLIIAEMPEVPLFLLDTYDNYSVSDFNGFGVMADSTEPFQRVSPPFDVTVDYSHPPQDRRFHTLADFRSATRLDAHSIELDYAIFHNLKPPSLRTPSKVYDPESLDFTLRVEGKAVDAGTVLPNVNDGFNGSAPDLGALEAGADPVHYGPR